MAQQNQRLSLLWRILSRHYGVIVIAAYAFAAIVGTTYYAILFDYFDLSVFDYWEPSDVLLAAFRQPLAALFGILAAILALVSIYSEEYNAWLRSKGDWAWMLFGSYLNQRLGWKWKAGPALIVMLATTWFLVVIHGTATGKGEDIWKGRAESVAIVTDEGSFDGRIIATTNRYVLLLEAVPEEELATALAFPVESIQSIRLCASHGGALHRLLRGSPCVPEEEAARELQAPASVTPNAEDVKTETVGADTGQE